jgi:hypothetical protein
MKKRLSQNSHTFAKKWQGLVLKKVGSGRHIMTSRRLLEEQRPLVPLQAFSFRREVSNDRTGKVLIT